MNVCVIIPAAGRSRRFGDAEKLAQDLGGRPLLLRTVELFTKRDEVRSILVAAPPEEFDAFCARFGPALGFHGASVVRGGVTERWETVKNALAEVPPDATHVAVHDAARPGTSAAVIDRVFEAAARLEAVIPVVPISATVKRVSDEVEALEPAADDAVADLILGDAGKVLIPTRRVLETIDRSNLVEVQTPQVFEKALLLRAYAQPDLSGATDDAMLVERLGATVHSVPGDPRNFKVTTREDLRLMRAVLGVKPPAERPAHKQF